MSKLPDAVPCPDSPPLHLKGGYLCIAAPRDLVEACFSVPAVRALKHARPQGTLAVLCEESQAALWQGLSQVDEVITYPAKAAARHIARTLTESATTFESAIVWESGEAAKAMARVRILQRLGYPAKGLGKLLTDPVKIVQTPSPIEHRVRYYLNLVEELGVEAYNKENFTGEEIKPPPEKLRIALVPGSRLGVSYQWPLERFVDVVNELNARYNDIDWVILGDGESKECLASCSALAELLDGQITNYAEKWGARELLAALPHCSALLACDSYVAHLAAHVGLPATVIFGPNEPQWKRPLGKQSRVVREHVPCSPCYLANCPLDMRCQNEINVDQVVVELEKTLALRYATGS